MSRLEAQEGIKFAEFDTGKSLNLPTVFVDEHKPEIYALWIQSYYLFRDSGCHNKCASEMCLNKTFGRNYLKPLDIEQLPDSL
jgi:hypothetical protein